MEQASRADALGTDECGCCITPARRGVRTGGAGYEDHGAPGARAVHHPGYYGVFVLDADGHNIEVVSDSGSCEYA